MHHNQTRKEVCLHRALIAALSAATLVLQLGAPPRVLGHADSEADGLTDGGACPCPGPRRETRRPVNGPGARPERC